MYLKKKLLFSLSFLLFIFVFFKLSFATIHDIGIFDFSFSPKKTTANKGDTLRWTNNGAFTHTSTSDNGIWNSGFLGFGGQYMRQFNTIGTFPYHCAVHPLSMKDTIIVVHGPNTNPVLSVPGTQNTLVQQAVNFQVSATDAEGDSVVITLDNFHPASGNAPVFTGGNPANFSWTPACTEMGTYFAVFKADDGFGGTDLDSVQINVTAVVVNVTIFDDFFSPPVETVQVCNIVKWTSDPSNINNHSTTSDAAVWNSGDFPYMSPGDTFSFQFTAAGSYPYHCIPHQAFGMVGTIVVESPCVEVTVGDLAVPLNNNRTPADVVTLINLVFKSRPLDPSVNPCAADVNKSGPPPSPADVVTLINNVFKSKPLPAGDKCGC